jgi:hypothetical protein
MNIFIDIETLRSPESHRLQIIEDVKANFKAPSTLTKGQAAIDLGMTDKDEIKFTAKDAMIARWENELAESKSESVANEKWEKTSFNPDVAPIACICIGYFSDGEYKKIEFTNDHLTTEANMLDDFHFTVNDICSKNGAQVSKPNFIGHYITKFDLPFIWKRSVINNVKTCEGVKWVDAKHGYNCYDTMTAWAGYGNSISADNLCNLLGIKGKTEGMDGSLVYDTWQTDPQKVIDYCHDDVQMVKEIHARLTK